MTKVKVSEAVKMYGDEWVWAYRSNFVNEVLNQEIRDQLVIRRCANLSRQYGRGGSMVFRAIQHAGAR
jgi:hypothetical protein